MHELLRRSDKKQIMTGNISDDTLEKISSLVKAENAEFSVSSPMDKLESFFIKTVSEAQEHFEPTSGALSTTEIGDFLKESSGKDLIDKLVTGDDEEKPEEKATETKEVIEEKISPKEPDKELLQMLTTPDHEDAVEPVAETEEIKKSQHIQPIEEEVDKNILDQLVKGDETPEQGPEHEGDQGNA